MAQTLEILLKLKDAASDELKRIGQNFEVTKKQIIAAGAAMTAIGVGALVMTNKSRDLNAQLGMTGVTLGLTTEQMRNLAQSTTDVSFPLDSVAATFEILARAGVRSQTELVATARAFDALADATGSDAETVAGLLIPAYKALGVALPKTANELDKFTWLTKNTTIDLSDFASVMQYVAREGENLDVTMDDMIAIMAVLESRGISGSAATMKFRMAVSQAVSENKSLNEVLGISQGELDTYGAKISSTTGLTQQYATVAEEQYGILDRLKQKWNELTLSLGSFLEPLEPIFALMTAMGPLIMLLSGPLSGLAMGFISAGKAALIAAAGMLKAAFAAIWAWAGPIPFVGPAIAIAAAAALVGSVAFVGSKIMEMVGLAEGGIVTRPTIAMIGERGPEAVIPLGRGMGNITLNITVQGSVISERDLAQSIRRELLLIKNRNYTTGIA